MNGNETADLIRQTNSGSPHQQVTNMLLAILSLSLEHRIILLLMLVKAGRSNFYLAKYFASGGPMRRRHGRVITWYATFRATSLHT